MKTDSFRYGETLPPETSADLLGLLNSSRREQICIDREMLKAIQTYQHPAHSLDWKPHRNDLFIYEIANKVMCLVVYRCTYGWRVFGRFKRRTNALPYDLSLFFVDKALLFPTAKSAIKAAELFSSGQHWDAGLAVWI